MRLSGAEFTLGEKTVPAAGALQFLQEGGDLSLGEVRAAAQFAIFGGEFPDSAVHTVTTGVAKIHLTVLDDGVEPVGDVKSAVWTGAHVDGPEAAMGAGQHIRQLLADVAAAALREVEAVDAVAAEIAGHQGALPVIREVCVLDDLQAALFGLAGVQALDDAFGTRWWRTLRRGRCS